MNIKKFIGELFQKGLRIGYSDGKMFDPRDQVRTTPNEDFIKAKEKKTKKMLDKMFQPVKKKKKEE